MLEDTYGPCHQWLYLRDSCVVAKPGTTHLLMPGHAHLQVTNMPEQILGCDRARLFVTPQGTLHWRTNTGAMRALLLT